MRHRRAGETFVTACLQYMGSLAGSLDSLTNSCGAGGGRVERAALVGGSWKHQRHRHHTKQRVKPESADEPGEGNALLAALPFYKAASSGSTSALRHDFHRAPCCHAFSSTCIMVSCCGVAGGWFAAAFLGARARSAYPCLLPWRLLPAAFLACLFTAFSSRVPGFHNARQTCT